MWHASAGEFARVITWLPNSQELVFAAGNVIVIMHSESLCVQALQLLCLPFSCTATRTTGTGLLSIIHCRSLTGLHAAVISIAP